MARLISSLSERFGAAMESAAGAERVLARAMAVMAREVIFIFSEGITSQHHQFWEAMQWVWVTIRRVRKFWPFFGQFLSREKRRKSGVVRRDGISLQRGMRNSIPIFRLTFWSGVLFVCPIYSVAQVGDPLGSLDPYAEPTEIVEVDDTLETMIVTASRSEESDFETPYVVERLDEKLLVERAVRNVPEALDQIPGVMVQKTSHGQGSPYIRGFTGYHNLFLIDGIRFNHAALRSGPNQYWSTVDAQGLGALELVKSQGSVLFGSDAVGGTLQALTLRPKYADVGFLASGRSYTRYGSGDRSVIQRAEGSVSEAGKYGLMIGGTYKDFGDIDAAGLGRLPRTGTGNGMWMRSLKCFSTSRRG